jgi:preprotein translocase subunit SecY
MLAVYRVGCAVPVPGVNAAAIADFFARASRGAGSLFGLLNLFTGGALEQFSVFALGIMPYISASIILQLLTVVIPQLEKLSKEGESGRKKITQYTRYGTVVLSLVQGTILSFSLQGGAFGPDTVINPGWKFQALTVLTLTSGTAFIMWLADHRTGDRQRIPRSSSPASWFGFRGRSARRSACSSRGSSGSRRS